MQFRKPVFILVAGVAAASVVLGACSGSSDKASPDNETPTSNEVPVTQAGHVAKAASAEPSKSAKMVCEVEAQQDIVEGATGVPAKEVTKPTWKDHLYSCTYVYPSGQMTLSVKELSTVEETTAYYDKLAQDLGKVEDKDDLGDAAFITENGNVVVRKDYKVLITDVSKLPDPFGEPPSPPGDVAINTSFVIFQCWVGE